MYSGIIQPEGFVQQESRENTPTLSTWTPGKQGGRTGDNVLVRWSADAGFPKFPIFTMRPFFFLQSFISLQLNSPNTGLP